jgi:hypothetical protein
MNVMESLSHQYFNGAMSAFLTSMKRRSPTMQTQKRAISFTGNVTLFIHSGKILADESRRYLYDNEEHSFLDPPSEGGNEYPLKCPSCKRQADMKLYNSVQIVDDGVALHGRVYHVDDYVYVKSSSVKKGLVLFIARIIKINCGTSDITLASDVTLRPGQLRIRHYERDPEDPVRPSSPLLGLHLLIPSTCSGKSAGRATPTALMRRT